MFVASGKVQLAIIQVLLEIIAAAVAPPPPQPINNREVLQVQHEHTQ